MTSLTQRFYRRCGPGALSGVRPALWLRTLRDNRFAIDWPYWVRAALITSSSMTNSIGSCWEALRFGRAIRRARVENPVFILGAWRSGTTHLHNLLSLDARFGAPTFFQVLFPWNFLTTEKFMAPLLQRSMPATRPQDNVRLGVHEPQEEEFALCSLIGRSILMNLLFPRNGEFYERYLSLDGLFEMELTEWKEAYLFFLRKLTVRYRRPLVLKSPGHTARIHFLLDLFPDARFVHIHRHPDQVYQSSLHTWRTAAAWWAMQRDPDPDDHERTVRQYSILYRAYFAQRDTIPRGNLVEVGYSDLVRDPMRQLRDIYDGLSLGEFEHVRPRVEQYLEERCSGYRVNRFPPLDEATRDQLRTAWPECYEAWGYE